MSKFQPNLAIKNKKKNFLLSSRVGNLALFDFVYFASAFEYLRRLFRVVQSTKHLMKRAPKEPKVNEQKLFWVL